MKCEKCGSKIEENDVQFCSNCGEEIKRKNIKNKDFQYNKFSIFDMVFHSFDLFVYNKNAIFQFGIVLLMFIFLLNGLLLNKVVIESVILFLSIFSIIPFIYISTIKHEKNQRSNFLDFFYGFKIARNLLGIFILFFSINLIKVLLFMFLDDLYVLLKIDYLLEFNDYIAGINSVIVFFIGTLVLYSEYLMLEKKENLIKKIKITINIFLKNILKILFSFLVFSLIIGLIISIILVLLNGIASMFLGEYYILFSIFVNIIVSIFLILPITSYFNLILFLKIRNN